MRNRYITFYISSVILLNQIIPKFEKSKGYEYTISHIYPVDFWIWELHTIGTTWKNEWKSVGCRILMFGRCAQKRKYNKKNRRTKKINDFTRRNQTQNRFQVTRHHRVHCVYRSPLSYSRTLPSLLAFCGHVHMALTCSLFTSYSYFSLPIQRWDECFCNRSTYIFILYMLCWCCGCWSSVFSFFCNSYAKPLG